MSSYSSLSRVLSPFRVQTKFEENSLSASSTKRYMADITLYCYLLDTPINSAIPVDIGETTRVEGVDVPIKKFSFGHLKKQIWPNNNEANKLRLWKFETPFKKDNEQLKTLNENFRNDAYLEQVLGEDLSPGELIRTIFPVGYVFPPNHIHIVVQPPQPATTEHTQKKRKLWHRDPKETSIIHGSSNEVRQVPISQSEFILVRENNLLYVDKTSWLAKLNLNCGYYFVSRPRKFGKSMFLSMFESFFLVQYDLFKGLHVYENPPIINVGSEEKEWNKDLPSVPVIRLDFSKLTSNEGPEMLKKELIQTLKSIGEKYNITLKFNTVKSVTEELITSLADHEENVYRKVVILVDEYDSPILSVFNATSESLTIADQNREILKGFFEILKALQRYIKFCLVTGVTMFSNMELFSGANQLTDMTMRDKLAGAYGFTADEIKKVFESKFSGGYCDIKETMTKLREKYNGYSWDGQTKVYNPYSICSFFDVHKLENFWIKKGRTSFLAKLISIEHIKNVTGETKIKSDFIIPVSIESIMNSTEPPISLLFQAGYLTIKHATGEDLFLEIPNNEVRNSLMGELWSNSLDVTIEKAFKRIELLAELLKKDDPIAFLKEFNNDLASIPYFESQHAGKYEGYYHSHIHMLVRYIGLPFRSEDATSEGRTDMWIETRNIIYYFEFKRYDPDKKNQVIMSLVEEAINQIFETKYYIGHTDPKSYNKTRYAVGCVCSTGTRKICGVGIQKFTYNSNGLERMELQNFLDEFSYQ